MDNAEWVRRYVFICQHPEQYRRAARQEFRVPVRRDTEWTRMAQEFVEWITKTLATGGRRGW